jgi:hypothetical protein
LGFIYLHVKRSDLVLSSLQILSEDDDGYVRMRANYSLGKIYIHKASKSENENECREFLETAILYFEKAAAEGGNYNPSKFCHKFYSSFDAVLFKKSFSKEEIDRYIIDAKKEVADSNNKHKILEVIEQLATVLTTAQKSKENSDDVQELLEDVSSLCNYADQLMYDYKDTKPAIYELYKKARPSFDRTIKELIDDVKEMAEVACKETKGTPDAEVTCSLYKEATKLDEAVSYDVNFETVTSIAFLLKGKINKNPEYHYLLPEIDKIYSELSLNRKLGIIRDILGVVEFGSSSGKIIGKLDSLDRKTDSIYETVQTTALSVEQILSSITQMQISQSGIKEEIQVTVGLSGFGSGVQHVITIPLQDISYPELKDDIRRYSDKMLDIAKLPARLKDKVIGYIRKNGDKLREE